jgi:hypothetical protein
MHNRPLLSRILLAHRIDLRGRLCTYSLGLVTFSRVSCCWFSRPRRSQRYVPARRCVTHGLEPI